MVKVDIVRAIQLGTDLQFGEAEKLVNDILGNCLKGKKLEKGEDVLITGLGKFELRDKKSRPGGILNQKGIMLFPHEEF
ncbi:MAG: hypothetical protein CM1200mP28_14850 [Deltaproteobacteria bacterium]|nr:MAG: hypothetical protein CM1200mP28_14850 [Deltaproteobacteria bacterium]